MTANELYKALLFAVRKHNMRSITPEEFNHFSRRAMKEYVSMIYWAYDVHQKSCDDLSLVVVRTDGIGTNPAPIPNSGAAVAGQEQFVKPSDYMYFLSAAFTAVYKDVPCKTDGTVTQDPIGAKLLGRNQTNYVEHNSFTRPMARYNRLYYQEQQNYFSVKAGKSLCTSMILEYIMYPQPAVVDPTTGATVTNPALGESQHQEILNWMEAIVLENIESYRLQTALMLTGHTFTQYPQPNQISP